MNRSAIREQAFKVLYSLEIQKDFSTDQAKVFFETNDITDKDTQEYILDAVNGIKENGTNIIETIRKYLKSDWSLERISKINLVILKLAIYEMEYKRLPYKVVINEAVEISKKYGDDTSHSFVNGMLASIVGDSITG